MFASIKGLLVTVSHVFKSPVTAQYPKQHLPVQERYMGFPVLTWDYQVVEPYCTGCMVCVRNCPTGCMSAQMMDNPLFKEGKSKRRKIIESFEINYGRCILCGICVKLAEQAREPLGLTFIGRGFEVRVAAPFGRAVEEGLQKIAQECVNECPTGALTFREKQR